MNTPPIETERKYLAHMPSSDALRHMPSHTESRIEQIYLDAPHGVTHRIRCRSFEDHTQYTETVKRRIDALRAFEEECEISEEEYKVKKAKRDTTRQIICKVRHTFIYKNQLFEVDIYPFWNHQCVVETELADISDTPPFPDCLSIIREVSGDRRYSNASLSRVIPKEEEIIFTP